MGSTFHIYFMGKMFRSLVLAVILCSFLVEDTAPLPQPRRFSPPNDFISAITIGPTCLCVKCPCCACNYCCDDQNTADVLKKKKKKKKFSTPKKKKKKKKKKVLCV